jgi:hypothetical protein
VEVLRDLEGQQLSAFISLYSTTSATKPVSRTTRHIRAMKSASMMEKSIGGDGVRRAGGGVERITLSGA